MYLQGELDELEREEFFRLKKVQAKKKRDAAEKDQAVIQVRYRKFSLELLKLDVMLCHLIFTELGSVPSMRQSIVGHAASLHDLLQKCR